MSQLTKTNHQNILKPYRDSLDTINVKILALLSERMDICMRIAEIKAEKNIPMMQPQRINSLMNLLQERSIEFGLREEYTKEIFNLIIKETCAQENTLIEKLSHNKDE
ncbi:chorismate mutase [Xenorhabdus bovienii]|nr:chorismate mutase [Xenorhabdus bovienii]MDE1492559.1 chorismate mutase [Xenorhabdus bovienii]MDE1497362.1 chorismate mutase [Xenorhabdus bovienii]MDE9474855.1 chorismate mutase [Xenorhabdus bovienii]